MQQQGGRDYQAQNMYATYETLLECGPTLCENTTQKFTSYTDENSEMEWPGAWDLA